MSRAVPLIYNHICKPLSAVLTTALLLALVGCATASDQLSKKLKVGEPVSRVYFAKYEDVEAAIKQAMIRYPQRVDNTEAGIFETDYLKGEARFKSPVSDEQFSPGYRYRLLLRLVRGKNDDKPAVKVLVTKQIELANDFFSEPAAKMSDGQEENVILYRISREILLARAMTKATDRETKKQQLQQQQQDAL